MPLEPAVTDIEQLKENPALALLLNWRKDAVQSVKWDRNELTIWLERESLHDAARLLRDDPSTRFEFLCDVTCLDWYPNEPRFEVVYHLLSFIRKERIRIKVRVTEADPAVGSMVPLWPSADPFEREVFDLFGIRFAGHPNLKRIMLPEDWEGHPLRKDYPVEGYR